ncbi:MAG: COG4315 family predicted lipoprotein [Mycobacteriales bacterium]
MAKLTRIVMASVIVFGLVGMASTEVATALAQRPAAGSGTVVKLRKTSYGKVLVGPNGKSLYVLTADRRNTSKCNALCRSAWPPLRTTGKPRAGTGINAAKLGQTSSHQVTYYGHPLYYYGGDSNAGQTSGEGVHSFGGYWWLLTRRGHEVTTSSGGGGYPY